MPLAFLAITQHLMMTYKTMQTQNIIYIQQPQALAEIKQPFSETSNKYKSYSKTDEASAEGWTPYQDISGEMC